MNDDPARSGYFTAVVADDLASVRKMIGLALERTGAIRVVAQARDGDEAIEAVERTRPDVVVLDLEMPKLGGLEVVPDLRALVPDAVIAVFSGLADLLGPEVASSGVDFHVDKQSSLENFVAELMSELTVRRVTGTDKS